jgi:D-aspartate ligase
MANSETMRIENNAVPVVVLVSSQHGGIGIIRSLGRAGIPVFGVHQHLWEPAAKSRFLRRLFRWDFSSASAANSVSFLKNVAQEIGQRPLLIATSDITALFLAENAEVLAEEYIFSTPPVEVVQCLTNKQRTSDLCRELRIPTADMVSPQSREDALKFAENKRFPVIVKGECGEFLLRKNERGRVAIVRNQKRLLEMFDLNAAASPPNMILQEYIPGGDDTVWMFNGYFSDQSECLFGATGRKLRQFPAHRGSTSLGVCENNRVVENQTLHLMRAVGYRGPVDLGYRFDARDGQYKLLDVNPRIGATFRLFVAENGLDVARALYLHLTQQAVVPTRVTEGRKWIVESNDLVSSCTAFRERQLSPAEWLRSLRHIEERVWLVSDDWAPLAALPLLWFRKLFSGQRGLASASSVSASSARPSDTESWTG